MAGQLHFAVSVPVMEYPAGPFGTLLYLEDGVRERIQCEQEYLFLPEGNGWGMELDEERLTAQLQRGDPGLHLL